MMLVTFRAAVQLVAQCFPLLHDTHSRDDIRTRLYQTVRSLLIANRRTALVCGGWLLLVASLLATLFRNHDTLQSLALPALVAEFRLAEALLHVATWPVVITSSSACICLQAHLLWHTKFGSLRSSRCWTASVVLLIVGLLSAGTFSVIVTKATVTVDQLEMGTVFNVLFEFQAVIRGCQSVFSAIFTAIVAPMSLCWVNQLDREQKNSLTNLLLWRFLLFVHWNILIPTFFSNAAVHVCWFESLSHFASFVYRIFVIVWLFLLVTYASTFHAQEEQGVPNPSELVRHRATIPAYPKSSPLAIAGGYRPLPPQPEQEMV